MPFLINSNVLIDVSRGNAAAINYVDGLTEPWVLVALFGCTAHRWGWNESLWTPEDLRKITPDDRGAETPIARLLVVQ
jgi:hypothetical protein